MSFNSETQDNQLLVSLNISKLFLIDKMSTTYMELISFDIYTVILFHHVKTNRNDNLLKLQVTLLIQLLEAVCVRFNSTLCDHFLGIQSQ